MKQATQFTIHPGWKLLISDMGINPADVLALAGLPADLFSRKGATTECKRLLRILEWNRTGGGQ